MVLSELLQIIGAVLVLSAFVAVQRNVTDPHSVTALLLNLVGSGMLAGLALVDHQWGFLLLEGGWAAVSASGLLRRARP